MRQRFDQRGVNSEDRIEQMREPDAVCLGHEPEQLPVAVEAPWLALFCHLKARFISAVQDLVAHPAGRVLVGEFQGVIAVPLDTHDGDEGFGKNASNGDVGLEILKSHEHDVSVIRAIRCRASFVADAINGAFEATGLDMRIISLSASDDVRSAMSEAVSSERNLVHAVVVSKPSAARLRRPE